jgi:hypothetical protein
MNYKLKQMTILQQDHETTMATITGREAPTMEGACKVVIENGFQVVKMPDGTTIPKQVWSRVYSPHDAAAHVILKLYVNLENDTAFNNPNEQPK